LVWPIDNVGDIAGLAVGEANQRIAATSPGCYTSLSHSHSRKAARTLLLESSRINRLIAEQDAREPKPLDDEAGLSRRMKEGRRW
jgi:hypothetical protein